MSFKVRRTVRRMTEGGKQSYSKSRKGTPNRRQTFNGPSGPMDEWQQLEMCVQRGLYEDVAEYRAQHPNKENEMSLCFPYLTRNGKTIDFEGKIKISLVHLAILEKKPAVLVSILEGMDGDVLKKAVMTNIVIVELERVIPMKKQTSEATKRMFTVVGKLGASLKVVSSSENEVDWRPTYEWNALHLAVRHDVECLKVLLYTIEQNLDQEDLDNILNIVDSKRRSVLHLAAMDKVSSTATKLLLDCGVKVDDFDEYLVTPLHCAAKYGVVDTVRELIDHEADRNHSHRDVSDRSVLHYANSAPMIRFLLERNYEPSLDILRHQTMQSTENVKVILNTCVQLNERENLLVLDLSLGMEHDRNGDTTVDGESHFLRSFVTKKDLLKAPIVESMLKMKCYAVRRVLLFDLILYMLFIIGMTVVICYSTFPEGQKESKLAKSEMELVDLVVKNYKEELQRRGFQFKPHMQNITIVEEDSGTPYIPYANTPFDPKFEELSKKVFMPYFGFIGVFAITVVCYVSILIREILELIAIGPRRYFSCSENVFQVFIISLTFICMFFLDDYTHHRYAYELLQVMTVFFGWLGLTLQLAKFPTIGIYIHMSLRVFRQLVMSLLVFMTIILAFSFSFHLALRKHPVFDNAFTSFLKTINMMVGEYNFDYDFTFESVRSVGGNNGIVQILLILFIFLVSITIANLIIAIIIANINKMLEEAEAYQLRRTVSQLSSVHNVKQMLIRFVPFFRTIFAATLYEHVGKKNILCVKVNEMNPRVTWQSTVESWFRTSGRYHPVYTYDPVYRKEMELTEFSLPEQIIARALKVCREKHSLYTSGGKFEGDCEDYSSGWREVLHGEDEMFLED
eukprot:GFUD01011305.1.p1 GENE.GFUD01011305.1~~GFUD01011305.1.p1  ORF type:complete len:883 (+),score=171.29 GFUD01011305.1:93-2651(+)